MKPTPRSNSKARLVLSTCISTFLVATAAHAAVFTWDSDTSTAGAQDGSGTWNTSGTNWLSGGSNVTFGNTNVDTAIFGAASGTAGTVTVSTVTANAITFNAAGSGNYTLSSGTITLAGATPTITANANATIGSALAGTAGLIKSGSATLTLSASNSYTGGTTVSSGTLALGNAFALGATTGNLTLSGGVADLGGFTAQQNQLLVSGSGSILQNGTLSLSNGGVTTTGNATINANIATTNNLIFNTAAGNTLQINGTASTNGNSAGLYVQNTGTLQFNPGSAYTATTTWANDGIKIQNGGTLLQTGGIITSNGGRTTIGATGTGSWIITGGTATLNAGNGGAANIGSNTTGNYGTLTLNGAGALITGEDLIINGTNAAINVQQGTIGIGVCGNGNGGTLNLGNSGNTGTALIRAALLGDYPATSGNATVLGGGGFGYGYVVPQNWGRSSMVNVNLVGDNGVISNINAAGTNTYFQVMSTITDNATNRGITFTGPQTAASITPNPTGQSAIYLEAPATYSGTTRLNGGALVVNFAVSATSTNVTAADMLPNTSPVQMDNNAVFIVNGRNNGTTTTGTAYYSTGSYAINIVNNTGTIVPGMLVTSGSAGFSAGVYVTAVQQFGGGNWIYLSAATTATSGNTTLTFTPQTFNTSQTINGLTLNSGASSVQTRQNSGNGTVLNLGGITRSVGATADFVLSGTTATNGITTSSTNTNGILGGYATVAGNDWASVVSGSNIGAYSGYTNDAWAAGNNTTVTINSAPGSSSTTNSLRFGSAGARTITLSGTNTLTSGGILVASAVGNNLSTITGGTLQGAAGADLVVLQNNTSNGLTIASSIIDNGGATGLTKSGAGLLTLTGSNAYTGATTINAGTLNLSNTNALAGGGNLTFRGGTLQFSASNANDYSSRIVSSPIAISLDTNGQTVTFASSLAASNTGGLNKIGGGTLILSGSNAYSGGTTVTGGTLAVSGAGTLGVITGTLALNGGALDLGGAGQTAGAVTITAAPASGNTIQNGALTGASYAASNGSGNAIVTANLGGAAATLTKTGAGTLTLSGSNTYGGATTVSAGTLSVSATNNLGGPSSNLVFNGGTLQITGTTLTSGTGVGGLGHALSFTSGQTVGLDINSAGNTFTMNQVLNQGTGGLTKLGAGTLVLSATNTYSGVTTVSVGTLEIANPSALYSGSTSSWTAANLVTANGATMAFNVGGTNDFTASQIATLSALSGFQNGSILGLDTTNAGGLFTYSNAIANTNGGANALGLTKLGAGTLTVSASNSYTGGTTIAGGTLQLGNAGGFGSTAGALTLNGAVADLGGYSIQKGSLTFGPNDGGVLQNGNLTLTGNSLTINGSGTIAAGASVTGSSGLSFTVPAGKTLTIGGTLAVAAGQSIGVTSSGTCQVNPGGVVSGSGGSGNLTIFGNNFLQTGGSVSEAGSGFIAIGINGGNGAYTITGGTLAANTTQAMAIAYQNSSSMASGTLTVNGAGALVQCYTGGNGQAISVAGWYGQPAANPGSGLLALQQGTVQASAIFMAGGYSTGTLQLGSASATTPATLQPYASSGLSIYGTNLTFILTGTNGVINSNDAAGIGRTVTVSLPIGQNTAGRGLTFAGSGTTTLQGASTYSGVTTLSGGKVNLGVAENSGTSGPLGVNTAAGAIVLGGGYLQYSGSNQYDYSARFSTAANQAYNADTNGQNVTWGTALASTGGSVTKAGAGTLTLAGSNSYSGATTVAAGTLKLTGSNTCTGATTVTGGALNLSNQFAAQNSTVTMNGGSLVFDQSVSGNAFTVGGLSATSSGVGYDIALQNNAGTPVAIALTVGGNNASTTYAGALSGSGTLIKTGGGTLALGGSTSAFTGAIAVQSGTLAGTLPYYAFGLYSPVTVSPGATLALSYGNENVGSLSGSGGTVSLGGYQLFVGSINTSSTFGGVISDNGGSLYKQGTGMLTLTGSNTYTGNTTIYSGTLQLGNGGATGSVVGNIVNSGVLVFNRSDASLAIGNTISGTGSLVQAGTGLVALSASNSYSGGTTVSSGTLALGNAFALGGTTANLTLNGGVADLGGYSIQKSSLTFGPNDGGVLQNGNLTLTGNSLTINGSGTIAAGAGVTGSANLSLTVPVGKTLTIGGTLAVAPGQSISVTSSGTCQVNPGGVVSASGGSGNLIIYGNNFLQSGGSVSNSGGGFIAIGDNGGNGAYTITGGTLAANTTQSMGIAYDNDVLVTGGTLTVNGSSALVQCRNGANGQTISLAGWGGQRSAATGLLDLQQGTVQAGAIYVSGGYSTGTLQFASASATSPATLQPYASNGLSIYGTVNFILNGTNGVIDSNDAAGIGRAVTVSVPIGENTAGCGLTFVGSGTTTLQGANTYSGGSTVNTGVLEFSGTASMPAAGVVTVNSAGTLAAAIGGAGQFTTGTSGAGTIGGLVSGIGGQGAGVTWNSGATLGIDTTSASGTYAGIIANSGTNAIGLAKLGTNTLTLTGTNTYTGPTTINAGTLTVSGSGVLGGGTYNNNIVNNGTFTYASSATQRINGNFSGNGALGLGGPVTVDMQGTSGTQASLTFGPNDGATLQNGNLTLTGNSLTINANATIGTGASVTGTGGLNVTVAAGKTLTIGGTLAPASGQGLSVTSSGTLQVNPGGAVSVVNATLNISGNNFLQTGGSVSDAGGGFIAIGYNGGNGAYTITGGTLAANITQPMGIAYQNTSAATSGTLTVNGASALVQCYTGGNGQSISVAGWYGQPATSPGSGLLALQQGTVQAGGIGMPSIYSTGTLELGSASAASPATLQPYASNGLSINGTNLTFILAGTNGVIDSNDAAGIGRTVTVALPIGQDTPGRGLTFSGSGITTLQGASTYSGPTTVTGGTLKAGIASVANTSGAFGNNSAVTLVNTAGVTLDITGYNTQIGSLTGGGTSGGNVTLGAATLTVGGDNTSPAPYAGRIAGTGGISKIGAGALTLSGSNSYSGGTTINGGTLNLGNTNALAGGGNIVFGGGTLQFSASNTNDYSAKIVSSGSAISVDTNGRTVTFASSLVASNTGGLNKTGSGTLILSGSNAYSGGTTVNSGTLSVSGSGTLGATTGALAANGGVLNLGTTSQTVGAVTVAGGVVQNGTLMGASYDGQSGTVSASLSGTGALTKTTGGTLALAGSNSYSGGTTVSNGSLQIGHANALGTGGLAVNGGTLDLAGNNVSVPAFSGAGGNVTNTASGTATFTANISGSSSYAGSIADGTGAVALIKSGTGTLALGGSNSHSGGTTVSSGSLQIGNANALGTGGLTVNAGTLDLNGNSVSVSAFSGAGGNVTNMSSGTSTLTTTASGTATYRGNITDGTGSVVLTNSGAGTLILSGSLTMAGLNANSGVTQITQSGSIGAVSVAAGATLSMAAHSSSTYNVLDISSLTLSGSTSGSAIAAYSPVNAPAQQNAGVLTDMGVALAPTVASSASEPASPEAVPEPGTLGMLLAGALGLLGFRRKAKRSVW